MVQSKLPNGFISVDDAIKLINKDSREHATVDTTRMVDSLSFLRVNGNFNIWLMETNESGQSLPSGHVTVSIESETDKWKLVDAIFGKWKEATGRDLKMEEIGLNYTTTAVNDETNPGGAVMDNDRPMIKPGEATTGGFTTTNVY